MRCRRRRGACCHDRWHHPSRDGIDIADAAAFADKGTCCHANVPATVLMVVVVVVATDPMVGAVTVLWIGGLVGRFGLQI